MKGLYVDRCPPVPFKGGEASVAIKKERLTKLSILLKGGESNGKAE